MSNKPTREESVAQMMAIQVFECPSLAEKFGRAFWGCKKALRAFLRCCRKVCGNLKRLTQEQKQLMEKVKDALEIVHRKEKEKVA